MSDLQNKGSVLTKEQSKEYAQNVINDIKSYNILNKNDAPNASNSLPNNNNGGSFGVENNADYPVNYNPNYDYGEINYDSKYDYAVSDYDSNYAANNSNYDSNYSLDYDVNSNQNNYVDNGYIYDANQNYYSEYQPEYVSKESFVQDNFDDLNTSTGASDVLDSEEEDDFVDYLLDDKNISSVITPASIINSSASDKNLSEYENLSSGNSLPKPGSVKNIINDGIPFEDENLSNDNDLPELENVESVIGKYNDTFDYSNDSEDLANNFNSESSNKFEMSNDSLGSKSNMNDINLSLFGFKDAFQRNQKNYGDEFAEYLSKRKIRKILHEKYGIDSKEILEYLYSKAMFNKWSEITLEKWLLNPMNLELLRKKFIKPKKIPSNVVTNKDKEIGKTVNVVKEVKEEIKEEPKKEIDNFCSAKKENESDKKEIVLKIITENNNCLNKSQDAEKLNFGKTYTNSNPVLNSSCSGLNIKEDLRSVIIEENYRKMQFDLQTEILKGHINDKFSALTANLNQNQYIQQPLQQNQQPLQHPQVNNYYDFFDGKVPSHSHAINNSFPVSNGENGGSVPKEIKNSNLGEVTLAYKIDKSNKKVDDQHKNIDKSLKDEVGTGQKIVESKKDDSELIKKTLSEEVGKVSTIFSNKLNSSIKNLNNYVHYLSDALDKKIGTIEKQMSGIANKLQSEENENLDIEERLQNVVSDVKNDLMEKLDSIEKNKDVDASILDEKINEIKASTIATQESWQNALDEKINEIKSSTVATQEYWQHAFEDKIDEIKSSTLASQESLQNAFEDKINEIKSSTFVSQESWQNALDEKINEIKSALFSKLENELEKNAIEIKSKTDEIGTRLSAIAEDVESRIFDNEKSIHNDVPKVVSSVIVNDSKEVNIPENYSANSVVKDESQVDNIIDDANQLNDNTDTNENNYLSENESENLYDTFLRTNIIEDNEEIVEKDNQDDNLLLDNNYLNQGSENFYNENENTKVNEIIDKSIGDISEVIDSLQSLNVNDDIIHSFEETSEKFKNIK